MTFVEKNQSIQSKNQGKGNMHQTNFGWSNRQIEKLRKSQNRLFEAQQQEIANKILLRQDNNMGFYQITPKDQLPKNLQKMGFQTLNTKQNNIGSIVKIHRKQKYNKKQYHIRKILKQSGQIMLLSQIYNYLDDPLESQKVKQQKLRTQVTPFSSVMNQLDQWQKVTSKKGTLQARFSKLRHQNGLLQQRRNSSHKKQFIVKKFKIGSDYKNQVQKSLQVINCSHINQPNVMTRYLLIQNSSKMLKKQLEQMKQIVEKQIEQKMKKLSQSRKEHHRLYEQKLKLQIQEQQLDQQLTKQQGGINTSNIYGFHNINPNNFKIVFEEKKNEIQKNQAKIFKIKKNIQFLQDEALKNQEELKNIRLAQVAYYKASLKYGVDCRQSGLVWIIKKLGIQETDMLNTEFPQYLDKKSKIYLTNKATSQQQLEQILQQKRQFVRQIGRDNQDNYQKRNSFRSLTRKSSIRLDKPISIRPETLDSIKQVAYIQCDNDIPKRYSRSVKKITALRQQYLKNQNLLKLTQQRGGLKFGYNLNGLTGRQIYNMIGQKMKKVDFSKLKKEKTYDKNDKIFQYQAILRKIQDLHMQMQEQDIQHQTHLLSQYKDQKQLFFTLAAACFGIKRAYSLIIKNFSWKNTI